MGYLIIALPEIYC